MIDRDTELNVLNALNVLYDITDVYFHKGKLYVINDYDLETVNKCLDELSWFGPVEAVSVTDDAYYGA